MGSLIEDLLLPRTDRAVLVQWVIAVPAWAAVLWATRSWRREYRQLMWGLATVTLAWFLLRMAH